MHKLEFNPHTNIPLSEIHDNVFYSCKTSPRSLKRANEHDRKVLLVGGGPSIHKTYGEIRAAQLLGAEIWSVNDVGKLLREKGIIPDVILLCDPDPKLKDCLLPESRHYIASRCDRSVVDKADGWLWHLSGEGAEDILNQFGNDWFSVGGGNTCILRGLSLAYMLGFRDIELHGIDSSLSDGITHAYPKDDKTTVFNVVASGRVFQVNPSLAMQADSFQKQYKQLTGLGCKISVRGDGLIPYIYKQIAPAPAG